jgi:hypothetical protein
MAVEVTLTYRYLNKPFKKFLASHPFPAFQMFYELYHFLYSRTSSSFISAGFIMSPQLSIFFPGYAAPSFYSLEKYVLLARVVKDKDGI